jgi:hypothetical protein
MKKQMYQIKAYHEGSGEQTTSLMEFTLEKAEKIAHDMNKSFKQWKHTAIKSTKHEQIDKPNT